MERFDKQKRGVASLSLIASEERPWVSAMTVREVFGFSIPLALSMLGETAVMAVDTKLVGVLGRNALGGVGFAIMLLYVGYVVTFGLERGVKVRTAYAVGRGEPDEGIRYAQGGALLALVAGLMIWVLGRDISPLLRLLRMDAPMIPYARDFFAAVTWGAPGMCVQSALIQHRQGLGQTRLPMVVTMTGNAINVVLALLLIHGFGPVPALGVRGAGYGTAIAVTINAIVFVALLLRDAARVNPLLKVWRAMRDVLSLGAPTAAQFGFELLAMSTFTALLSSIAAVEVAAHQIALTIIRVSFLPGVAVSEATSVLVGQSLGGRNVKRADEVVRAALVIAVTFMSVWALIFAALGGTIAGFFDKDPEVQQIATRLLMIAAAFQVCDAINIVLRGALRGAKDVMFSAFVSASIIWLTVPTAAWLLGHKMGWGAFGGWLGFVAETTVAAIVLGHRWWRGPWRRGFYSATS